MQIFWTRENKSSRKYVLLRYLNTQLNQKVDEIAKAKDSTQMFKAVQELSRKKSMIKRVEKSLTLKKYIQLLTITSRNNSLLKQMKN